MAEYLYIVVAAESGILPLSRKGSWVDYVGELI